MSSKAVNVPTDPKQKEKDINSKLQLYGIYSAFAQGKVPSNKQIDVALNSVLEWKQLKTPNKKLSQDGQVLSADLRDVIEKAKLLLLTKNDGNLLQEFIWETQGIGSGEAPGVNAPLSKDTAKQHGNQALEGLRTLGTLIITNGQFRKLLNDATILLRDVAGDAAQKAAAKVNPADEELNQIDEHAEPNTWHDTPDLSKDSLKNRVQSSVPIGKRDVQDAADSATKSAAGTTDPTAAAQQANSQDARDGAATGAQQLKNKISANVDEDQKQRAREYRERTKKYFKEKVPKDRRDNVILRLKKMIVEIQGHQDYSQAIDTLLRLAEEYSGHAKNVTSQGTDNVKGARNQDSLQNAEANLKTLLERFANGTSFDDLIGAIDQIYTDANNDPELKNWFRSLDRFIRKCLQEQGFVLQDDANDEWNDLYDHGNFLLRERYRNHTDRVVDELKFLAGQFDDDVQNKRFAASLQKLFQDLGTDDNGKAEFKPHLLKDLSEVIIPGFFESVRYVPIPRIEISDPQIDAIVENLVIEGDNLAPNILEFQSDNFWHWARKGHRNRNKNKLMLAVSGVQMDLRDVAYYVKRKQGFPGVTDLGVMDIFLGGEGLSFKVAMETADPKDKYHFFKINTVDVELKHLNIKLKKSNHKLLFALFKPLLLKVLRPVIQKVAEKEIRNQVANVDALLHRVKVEADRALEEAKSNPDPENVQNIYQRYLNAFQAQLQKGKAKKDEVASNTTVNVAMTQHDSIFKNIALPGGISTSATKYRDLAEKGERWESPVFSIGSASETANLPAASAPVRKPHSATPATLNSNSASAGSNQFSGSNQYTGSNQFAGSNQYAGSNQFAGSNQYTGSNQFASSNTTSQSGVVGSNQFVGSNPSSQHGLTGLDQTFQSGLGGSDYKPNLNGGSY